MGRHGFPAERHERGGVGDAAGRTPAPDWAGTVRALIEAGAATRDVTLSPDDPKPPSPEVAGLLRGYGIGSVRG